MLDFDLAEIYGYETKYFNRQVKNNIERFDEDFRFQLTEQEFENLRCKNFTSSWGGKRYLPHAFTEEGIYMLMTVLKGDIAVSQSKKLIRLFKKMKNFIIQSQNILSSPEFIGRNLHQTELADFRREYPNVDITLNATGGIYQEFRDFFASPS